MNIAIKDLLQTDATDLENLGIRQVGAPINIIAFSSVCWVGIVAHISEPMLLYTNKTSTLFSVTKAFESNGRCPVKSQSFSRGDYYLAGGNRVTKGAVQQTFYDLGRLLTTQDNCPVQ